MENHNWVDIKGSAAAPYINGLLATAAHAEQYYSPPGNHPSEPNYIWLESGSNYGITTDNPPGTAAGENQVNTTAHLVTQLEAAGRTWRSYQEDISGMDCPLVAVNNYAPKHNPMVFFPDVTDDFSPTSAHCIAHVRPYTELATDLAAGTVADYNFITPNLCDDMHNTCTTGQIRQGDAWLAAELPKLVASATYAAGAVVFITWDENELGNFPIGMIAVSKDVKPGYSNTVQYTHSSLLRSVQSIFGLSPFLKDAANATDLGDFFATPP
jgi:phospholipase C